MARDYSSDMLAAIAAREIARATFYELKCDEGSLYAWNQHGPITESAIRGASTTWEGLGERIQSPGGITLSVDLQGATTSVVIDASAINDDTDFCGRLVDRTWHQREIIVRDVLFVPGSNMATVIDVLLEWVGIMDSGEMIDAGDGSVFALSCESGSFEFFRSNQLRREDAGQQARFAGDRFFDLTAVQVLQSIPFGTSWHKIGGGN